MTVFRYLPPERIDTLEKETVTFTPPDRFNDLFEMRPVFAPVTSSRYWEPRLKQQMAESGVPNELALLPRKERRARERRIGKNVLAKIRKNALADAGWMGNLTPGALSAEIGVLCFSRVKDSLLMWAHYTDNHRGFVVENDAEHSDFQNLGRLQPVDYASERPVYDRTKGNAGKFHLVKSPEWSYEKEFRIVRLLNQCRKQMIDGQDLYFVRAPRSCIKAVYLGARTEPPLIKRLHDLSKSTPFVLYRGKPHETQFRLVFDKIV